MSDTPPNDPPERREDDAPEVELTGPIGWLFGLISQLLMLGVKIAVALVQGIFGAFLGGGGAREEADNSTDNSADNSKEDAP